MSVTNEAFSSGGRRISIEVFLPDSATTLPGVLVLHGTFGLLPPFGPDIVSFAEALVTKGIAAIVPRYFERTDTNAGEDVDLHTIAAHLRTWEATCGDALAFMATDARFDPMHLGVIGFSLGGHLALSLAMAATPPRTRLKCVIDFFGPTLGPPLQGTWSALPPILIHHGTADTTVPLESSTHLVKMLEAAGKVKGVDFELLSYDGQGHGFREPALTKSRDATVEFLQKRL